MKDMLKDVTERASALCQDKDCTLVSVRWKTEEGTRVLEVIIDREGGVGIEDATAVNQALSDWLDGVDLGVTDYCLEVSSRGTERELLTDEDRRGAVGTTVLVTLRAKNPEIKSRAFQGTLRSADEKGLVVSGLVKGQKKTLTFAGADIASVVAIEEVKEEEAQ